MKNTRILTSAALLSWLVGCIPANAADSAAGQKTFAASCAACHQLKSYAGKSDADLETALKGIVAGTVKHPKKLTLNATDIENIAAYIAANEPK